MAQTSDSTDTNEEEEEPYWSARAKISASTRRTRQGADVSNDKPSVSTSFGLSYDLSSTIGLSLRAGTNHIIGERPSLQGFWGSFDVSYSATGWLSFSLSYTRDVYPTDPSNLFGDLTNTFFGSLDTDFDWFGWSASFTYLPGNTSSEAEPAKYLGLGGFMAFSFGNLNVSPNLDCSFISQRVKNDRIAGFIEKNPDKKLPPGFNKKLYTQVEGLSSVSITLDLRYKLGGGFKLSFSPSFLYTPKTDVFSTRSAQIVLTGGIQYSLSF